MRCYHPIGFRNEKLGTWKDVPCGRCYGCLSNKRNEWTFRMMNEQKKSINSFFVTLTYDGDNLPTVNLWDRFKIGTLDVSDVQKFHKRLRKFIMNTQDPEGPFIKFEYDKLQGKEVYSPSFRFFLCGEYGSAGNRPHYHGVYYNVPADFFYVNPLNGKIYSDDLEEIWKKGFVDVGELTQARMHYAAKYTLTNLFENFKDDVRKEPFALMSRDPGIGANYVEKDIKRYFNSNKNSYAIVEGGFKQRLGRYYKEKIFEDEEVKSEVGNRAKEWTLERIREKRKELKDQGIDPIMYERDEERIAINKLGRKYKKLQL